MRQNGSVVKRGNSYSAVYADPNTRDAKGRKKPRWRSFPTEEAANAYLNAQLGAIRSGVHVPPSQETWDTLMTQFETDYLDHMVRINEMSPSTRRSYQSVITKHLRPYWGALRVMDMTPLACRTWARVLSEQYVAGEPIANKTVTNIVNLMSKICGWAKVNAFVTHNWVKDAEIVKPSAPPLNLAQEAAKCLDEEELARVVASWRNPTVASRAKVLSALGVLAGLRRGEIAGLPWGAIHWDDGQVRVMQSVADGELRTNAKSDASRAFVDVPPLLLAILREHQAVERAAGRSTKPGAFVLQNPAGKLPGQMYHPDELSEYWDSVRTACALPETATLHVLRHTFASLLIRQKENIKYVSQQMRHANIQITIDRYSHLFKSDNRAAMERFNAQFAPAPPPPSHEQPGTAPRLLPFTARG